MTSPDLRAEPTPDALIHPSFEGLTLDQQYDRAAEMVGNAKFIMQTKAGRGNGDQTNLKNALGILESTTASVAEEKGFAPESDEFTLLQIESMELASEKQVLRAAEEEAKLVAKGEKPPSMLARAGNIAAKVVKSKTAKVLLAAGLATAVAVGVATGIGAPLAVALPAIASKALIGLGAGAAGGGAIHAAKGASAARKERQAEHTEEKTRERMDTELAAQKTAAEATGDDKKSVYQTAFEQAVATREENTQARKKMVGGKELVRAAAKGGAKGLVVGAVGGTVLASLGYTPANFLGKWSAFEADTSSMLSKQGIVPNGAANAVPTPKVTPSVELTPSPKVIPTGEVSPGAKVPFTPPELVEPGVTGTEGPTLTTPEATAAEQAMIDEMMEKGAEVGKTDLKEAAATFEGKGNNIWAKAQNAAGTEKLTNRETWYLIVGDGPKSGGLEQMNASGLFDIDMGGQSKMTPEGIKFSGDKWWVSSNVAKEDLYIVSADGKTTLFFDKGHNLTQNEQLAALKLMSQKGTEILDADTVREMIDKEFNPTPEQLSAEVKTEVSEVTTEFDKQWNERTKLDPDMSPEAAQSAQRAQIQAILDANAETLKNYPDTYLKFLLQQLDARSDVPPAVIEEMLEKSLGKQLQLV